MILLQSKMKFTEKMLRAPKFPLNQEIISGLIVKACELREAVLKIRTSQVVFG